MPSLARRGLIVFVVPPLLAWASPSARQDGQEKTAPFPRAGSYAGEAVCKDCHEEQWEAIHGGAHRAVVEASELRACETCHGPGKAHADDDDNDTLLITHPPDLGRGVVAFCGRCHAEAARAHGGDLQGFLAAGKTCTTCHEVHRKTPPAAPHAGVAFFMRRDQAAHADIGRVGAAKCVECHPLRDQALAAGAHAHLAASHTADGCETCHGPGSLHVETGGLARLITRPDRAGDGPATCRSCHEEVDPQDFHWKDRRKPLLSSTLTCTTCHSIHGRVSPDPAPSAAPVTNEACGTCHEPAFAVLEGTIHDTLGRRTTPLAEGCAACHPGALAHAESGGKPSLVESMHSSSASLQQDTCLRCHEHESALAHLAVGSHARHEVSCLSCHSPAAKRGEVRRDAETKCTACHQAVAAEFAQPNHHPVPEHAMGCSDCHDPHGARPKLRDLELRQDRCVRCHSQYRGPFVFAHQASRSDGCVVCHQPHGASNKRLLRQHTTQQNCLQCHADFPIFHDQTAGAVFTNCLNCHTEVHGSNHARYLFR
ncbi:MAG: cytochrome c3 family protein [Planctomycetota bacterium]